MRAFRIMLGLAATLCAFGVSAVPALAHPEKPKAIFGKFIANYPLSPGAITPTSQASDRGLGSVEEINLADDGLVITKTEPGKLSGCTVKSKGKVESESSDKFFQAITFSKCYATKGFGKHGEEKVKLKKFNIDFEYSSDGALKVGEGEGEIKIVSKSALSIPVGKNVCTVVIPEQTLPAKALIKEEEYESAEYETEVNHEVNLKKFPAGFQNKLDIEMHFKKIETWVKPVPGCEQPGGALDETPETPAFGYDVFNKGNIEMELEEITIKNGNLGFETKAEVEKAEKEQKEKEEKEQE